MTVNGSSAGDPAQVQGEADAAVDKVRVVPGEADASHLPHFQTLWAPLTKAATPAVLASIAAFLFVVMKLATVARFDGDTAIEIVRSVGTVNVILASAVLVLPILINITFSFAMYGLLVALSTGAAIRWWLALMTLLLIAGFVALPWLFFALIFVPVSLLGLAFVWRKLRRFRDLRQTRHLREDTESAAESIDVHERDFWEAAAAIEAALEMAEVEVDAEARQGRGDEQAINDRRAVLKRLRREYEASVAEHRKHQDEARSTVTNSQAQIETLITRIHESELRDELRRAGVPRSLRTQLRLAVIATSLVLLASLLSDRMWIPTERVTVSGNGPIVGYVLSTDGEWTTILRATDRSVVYSRSARISGRTLCTEHGGNEPSVLSLLGGSEGPMYPDC